MAYQSVTFKVKIGYGRSNDSNYIDVGYYNSLIKRHGRVANFCDGRKIPFDVLKEKIERHCNIAIFGKRRRKRKRKHYEKESVFFESKHLNEREAFGYSGSARYEKEKIVVLFNIGDSLCSPGRPKFYKFDGTEMANQRRTINRKRKRYEGDFSINGRSCNQIHVVDSCNLKFPLVEREFLVFLDENDEDGVTVFYPSYWKKCVKEEING